MFILMTLVLLAVLLFSSVFIGSVWIGLGVTAFALLGGELASDFLYTSVARDFFARL